MHVGILAGQAPKVLVQKERVLEYLLNIMLPQ